MEEQYAEGYEQVQAEIGAPSITEKNFFRTNTHRLEELQKTIHDDLQKVEHATLRHMDDVYRSTIFEAETMIASGAATLTQAIDQAVKSFLERGINCIEYKDGRRVNIATYAEMALRAAGIRSYMRGEGQRRKELGLTLVICNVNDSACPKCVPWDAEILIDDVWSGGHQEDHPEYRLLSEAIDKGFLHPNCEDGISTYIPGVTRGHQKVDPEKAAERYKAGQKQRAIERQIRRFKRLAEGTADPEQVREYKAKVRQWQAEMREHLAQNPQLRREYRREKIYSMNGVAKDQNPDILNMSINGREESDGKPGNALLDVGKVAAAEMRSKYKYLYEYGKTIISDKAISGLFVSRMEFDGNQIDVSLRASQDWTDMEELEESIQNASEYGFFPPNYTPKSLVYHEYGHMTEIAMALHDAGAHLGSGNSLSSVEKARKLVRDGTISKAIRDEALASLHIEESKVAGQLSERAQMDSREFLAEAFGEYESQNPRPLAAKTIEIILRELRKRGMIQ